MMDVQLLQLLRCPETREPLSVADARLLEQINSAIGRHELANRLGEAVTRPVGKALINRSSTLFYPVYDEIPQLVADQAISLDQLPGGVG